MLRLLAATLLAALTAAPVLAGSLEGYRGTGEVYVGAGRNFADDSDVDEQAPTFLGGRAYVYAPLDQDLVGHLDLGIQYASDALEDADDSYTHYVGVAHLNYVRAQRFAIGGAAGLFGGNVLSESDQTYWLLAAEGRFQIERGSIWAQVGYFDALSECHKCSQQWWHEVSYVRGGVNYFVEDDLKLALELGQYQGYVESQDQAPLADVALEVEGKVDTQVSLFARYRNTYFANEDEDDPLSQNSIFAGVRVRWGQGETDTLRASDFHSSIGTPDVAYSVAVSDDFD
jgi:hypothetical protein